MGDDVAEFALLSIFHEFQKRFACLSGNLKECFCEIFFNVDKGLELNKFIDVRKVCIISWVYDNALVSLPYFPLPVIQQWLYSRMCVVIERQHNYSLCRRFAMRLGSET